MFALILFSSLQMNVECALTPHNPNTFFFVSTAFKLTIDLKENHVAGSENLVAMN